MKKNLLKASYLTLLLLLSSSFLYNIGYSQALVTVYDTDFLSSQGWTTNLSTGTSSTINYSQNGAVMGGGGSITVDVTQVRNGNTGEIGLAGSNRWFDTPLIPFQNNSGGTSAGTLSITWFNNGGGRTFTYFIVNAQGQTIAASGTVQGTSTPGTNGTNTTYVFTLPPITGSQVLKIVTNGNSSLLAVTVQTYISNTTPVINAQSFFKTAGTYTASAIGTVAASDAEVPATQTLTYSITSNPGGLFAINASTGALTVTGTIVAGTSYPITVQVCDNYSTPACAINTITVSSNNPPVIGAQSFFVNEDVAVSTAVGTVVASDPTGQTITYSITAGNGAGKFAINSATGAITVAGALDFETTSSYPLTVQVCDNGTPVACASNTVTVNVNDVVECTGGTIFQMEDYYSTHNGSDDVDSYGSFGTTTILGFNGIKPGGTGDWRATYMTMAELGLAAGVYDIEVAWLDKVNTAGPDEFKLQIGVKTDPDNGPTGPPNSTGTLAVDDSWTDGTVTGQILRSYSSRTLTASDRVYLYTKGVGGSSDDSGWDYIKFTLVNATAPEFTDADDIYPVSIDEGVNLGTAVVTTTATDPDAGQTLSYSITAGNGASKFAINSATGAITVVGSLDAETTSSYSLTVQVTDNAAPCPKIDIATVNITINNLTNENAPTISLQTRTVAENSTVGTLVGAVIAASAAPDGDGPLSYSIIGGNTGSAFAINSSGQISVNAAVLNYEVTPTYSLTVQVCDAGSPSRCTPQTITINLTDVNENPNAPVITGTTFSVAEHSPQNTVVGTRTGTDADGHTLSYAITGGTGVGKFAVNSTTGQITVIGSLDFETLNSYTLFITATDNGEAPRSSTPATITINLTNVTEDVPFEFNLYYGTCSGTTVPIEADLVSSTHYFMGWAITPGGATTNITDAGAAETTVTNHTSAVSYVATIGTAGPNLVTNGSFESGNTGFTSEYTYASTSSAFTSGSSKGKYGIGDNADQDGATFYENSVPAQDGTQYLYGDAFVTSGKKIYSTNVPVVAGETYVFSVWAANGHEDSYDGTNDGFYEDPAHASLLNFDIGGTNAGNIQLDNSVGVWQRFTRTYVASVTGSISISIENNNTEGNANDFLMDNVEFRKLTPASTATINVPACTVPLPVTLTDFTGSKATNGNILSWITASENNNNYFVVERSADGVDFIAIGTVQGHGNSSVPLTYNFNDDETLSGTNYYRLKQVDYNGVFNYSKIIAIGNETQAGFNIYPNPNNGRFTIKLLSESVSYKLDISDVEGRLVYSSSGSSVPENLEVSNLSAGMYIVHLYLDNATITKKLVVY